MAILATRGGEFMTVGRIGLRSVRLRWLAVVSDPFPRDVAQVGIDRLWRDSLEIDDPGLDHHPA